MSELSKKKPWFQRIARGYVKRKLGKTFSDVRLIGVEHLRRQLEDGPAIVACNHVAWWDPLVLVHLDAWLDADSFCLMDKSNLDQLSFFAWVGAVPLDRSKRTRAYRDLKRSESLLDRQGRLLFIFPHGHQRPAHLPLDFHAGVASLAKGTRCPVIPLAIRYDYAEGPRQLVHLAASPPISTDGEFEKSEFLELLERGVSDGLAQIDEELSAPGSLSLSLLGKTTESDRLERIPTGAAALKLMAKKESP